MPETIETTFDASILPRWARNHPAVVARCKHDLAYRCNVHEAQTRQMRQQLIRDADRN